MSLQKPLAPPAAPRSERVLTPASWPWAQWLAWPPRARCWSPAAAWRGAPRPLRQREQAARRPWNARWAVAGIAHELNQPLTAILASDPRRRTRWTTKTNGPPCEGPAGQRRPGRAATSSPACACAPSAPAREALDPEALANSLRFLREQELGAPGRAPGATTPLGERLLGDRVALEQILHNLVQNAVDALAGMRGAAPARG